MPYLFWSDISVGARRKVLLFWKTKAFRLVSFFARFFKLGGSARLARVFNRKVCRTRRRLDIM